MSIGAPKERESSSPLAPHSSRISLIVAVARNGVIGAGNQIPWHLPAELKIFKSATMGHHIVMGRRTWESIGRLLPGRTTVIVTRQQGYDVPGAIVAHSLEAALAACRGDDEIFVIGGAELFRETLPIADRLHYTVVETEPAGDVRMPKVDWNAWREVSAIESQPDERNPLAFRYAIYERRRP